MKFGLVPVASHGTTVWALRLKANIRITSIVFTRSPGLLEVMKLIIMVR